MQAILSKKKILFIIEIISIMFLCVGFGNAAGYPIPKQLPFDPNKLDVTDIKSDDGVEIQNFTSYIIYWNERMHWGFSEKEIIELSFQIENHSMKSLVKDGNYFHVGNLTKNDEEISTILNLSEDQKLKFIEADRNQLEIDHQNFDKLPQDFGNITAQTVSSQENVLLSSIAPASQSAPYALGDLYYLFIFVDFSTPSGDGHWTDHYNHEVAAQYNATYGIEAIQLQAPPGGVTSSQYGLWDVVVNGEDTGGGEPAWGIGGWMEQAAYNLGFRVDSNGDGRTTDDMVRWIKDLYGPDSVLIVYCTHDDKGAYTMPVDGYADWVVVSHWGKRNDGSRFDSEAGSYEHEILHQYGALDEWIGGSYCGEKSGLSVSPMHEMYTNTNHVSCPLSTQSVMRNYSSSSTQFWYLISDSTAKFIGWGDFDGDGELDPRDGSPYGTGGLIIGVFRSGEWILDYGIDGTVDRRFNYGLATDIPVVGNFNNDGTPDIGVFRSGQWILDYGIDGTVDRRLNFARTGDKPVVGDFNNNGITDIGVFRSGEWILDYEMDGTVNRRFNYGLATDIPVVGDFNNNGQTDIGVFRSGQWILDYGMDGTVDRRFNYGRATDIPVVGNFNNDGQTDIGVFRSGQWILDYGMDGIIDRYLNYGLATDIPVTGKWI